MVAAGCASRTPAERLARMRAGLERKALQFLAVARPEGVKYRRQPSVFYTAATVKKQVIADVAPPPVKRPIPKSPSEKAQDDEILRLGGVVFDLYDVIEQPREVRGVAVRAHRVSVTEKLCTYELEGRPVEPTKRADYPFRGTVTIATSWRRRESDDFRHQVTPPAPEGFHWASTEELIRNVSLGGKGQFWLRVPQIRMPSYGGLFLGPFHVSLPPSPVGLDDQFRDQPPPAEVIEEIRRLAALAREQCLQRPYKVRVEREEIKAFYSVRRKRWVSAGVTEPRPEDAKERDVPPRAASNE